MFVLSDTQIRDGLQTMTEHLPPNQFRQDPQPSIEGERHESSRHVGPSLSSLGRSTGSPELRTRFSTRPYTYTRLVAMVLHAAGNRPLRSSDISSCIANSFPQYARGDARLKSSVTATLSVRSRGTNAVFEKRPPSPGGRGRRYRWALRWGTGRSIQQPYRNPTGPSQRPPSSADHINASGGQSVCPDQANQTMPDVSFGRHPAESLAHNERSRVRGRMPVPWQGPADDVNPTASLCVCEDMAMTAENPQSLFSPNVVSQRFGPSEHTLAGLDKRLKARRFSDAHTNTRRSRV